MTAIVLLLVGCGSHSSDRSHDDPLPVFAGVPPMAYLVEQVGGSRVKVDVLVQPGQDPHTFEPTPQQVLSLSRAAIFFKVGMPFEGVLLQKVRESNRRLTVVDVGRGVEKRAADASSCEHADHGHAEHQGEPDPHIWLSPTLLKTQAANVAAALCQADPTREADYRRNLANLLERIDAADRRIRQKLAPHRDRSFYVFHPGFGYFADAYGLKQEVVESSGRSPTLKQLHALIDQAHAEGVKTIFAQPEFAPQSARVIANAIGGKVVPLNGLAKDVLADLDDIAAKIDAAMQQSSPRDP